jgi:hypothetical protein
VSQKHHCATDLRGKLIDFSCVYAFQNLSRQKNLRIEFKERCMSACTVWALILAVAAIVATGFAYRYKHLANRMKARARIYMRYVPTDKLTGQERVIFEDLKKDIGS